MKTFYVCWDETDGCCGSAHHTENAARQCAEKMHKQGDRLRKPYPVDAHSMGEARRLAAKAWGFTEAVRNRRKQAGEYRGLPFWNKRETWSSPKEKPLSADRTPPTPSPTPSPTPKKAPMNPDVPPQEAIQLLMQMLSGPSVDIEAIEQKAAEAARKEYERLRKEDEDGVRKIQLVLPDRPDKPVVEGLVHNMMPTLLEEVALGNSVWLAGPAGSGKTHAAEQVSQILDRKVFIVGQIVDAHADVVGYNDAHGKYQETPLYKWATSDPGAILVLDEIDGSDPNALLKACAIFAKGTYTWPNGVTTRIPDEHVLIACANTWGAGAEDGFTGRETIDEATRNRFTCRLLWEVDPDLERAISVSPYEGDDRKHRLAGRVVSASQRVRKNLKEAGINDFSWGPRDTQAAVRRAVKGFDPFKNSVVATLDPRQQKMALEGVTVS